MEKAILGLGLLAKTMKSRITKPEKTVAVLLDVNLQALKIIRSLGRRGIPVIGVVSEGGRWEQSSRYSEIRVTPHLKECGTHLRDYLIQLAREFKRKPVLIPMQDDTVLFASQFRNDLLEHYRFLMAEQSIMTALVSKSGLHGLAQQYGIPQPDLHVPDSIADLKQIADKIKYPVVIKPAFSMSWQNHKVQQVVNGKVYVIQNRQELLETYPSLARFDKRLVIQEIIPGSDRNLIYYVGYFDRESEPLASFVGVKERVVPVHYGSASFVLSRYDENLIQMCTRFMKQIGYKGHVGIEFKFDDRDRAYKLIEVNARFGLWDGMATKCGIDFPFINYQYLQDEPVTARQVFDDGVKWISFKRDLRAFSRYRQENSLSVFQWIKSISTGRRDYAVFAVDDLKPFILSTSDLVAERIRLSKK